MKLRAALILLFLTVAAYANTIGSDFVAGDRQFILRNSALDDPRAALRSFTTDYWGTLGGQSFVYYRPLVVLTHAADVALYGRNPAGHHLTNILLHGAVTLLVFGLFLRFFSGSLPASFTGAALFALHPVHTHSVSYIMGRTDILAALFYSASLLLLTGGLRGLRNILAAGICYGAALLCKEIAVTLPAVYILYRLFWQRPSQRDEKKRFYLSLGCLAAVFLAYMLLRWFAVGMSPPQAATPPWHSLWQRSALVIITGGFYLGKLLLPTQLCYYSNLVVPGSWTDLLSSAYFSAGAAAAVLCVASAFLLPRLCFALAWIACTLLPVLNIVALPVLAKENYLYLPSVGFCLLFSMIIFQQTGRTKARRACIVVCCCIGLAYGAATLRRNTDYRDPVTFLRSTLAAMPPVSDRDREDVRYFEGVKNRFTTWRNLGRLYMEQGHWQEAARAFESALSYIPSYFPREYAADVLVSLGAACEKAGELEKASAALTDAAAAAPQPDYAYNLLGVIAVRQDRPQQAEEYFKKAIDINRSYAPAFYNLGMLCRLQGRQREARQYLGTAARLNPEYRSTAPPEASGEMP